MRAFPLLGFLLAQLALPVASQAADSPAQPVVVELFTSQGCSSCPPADRVLAGLAGDPLVVPLAFHVDYWNRLGWRDPFSSADWSARQQAYARRFGSRRVYTPQVVVDGGSETVGSNGARVAELIRAAGRRARRCELRLEAAPAGDGSLAVGLDARLLDPPAAERLTAYLVVFESGLETAVERGENGGRTLRNDFVVRRLEPLFDLTPASPHQAVQTRLAIEPGWRPAGLGVAVFVQDPASLAIHGAARTGLP